jgi:ATP-dependent helicase Lhr and Lhr-like helicase
VAGDALEVLPAIGRDVFLARWGRPTAAQALAWPAIAEGRNVLVVAPTGSGKTLAAFTWFLADLVARGKDGDAARPAGVEVVYVSPLKALAADIERNLREPLALLRAEARRRGEEPPTVPVAVRTGDTPARERAALRRKPPRVLVTTPESLYLILTSPRARDALRTVRAVIVDEVHALLPSKRVSTWRSRSSAWSAWSGDRSSASGCRRRSRRSRRPRPGSPAATTHPSRMGSGSGSGARCRSSMPASGRTWTCGS